MSSKVMFYLLALSLLVCGAAQSFETVRLTPQEAQKRLMSGNERYVKDKLEHPDRTSERREALTASQSPFATILGCSDSRVSPEIVFDQGIGDLFVVRVAGNVVSRVELDSIDYSAIYLGSSIILVLGHENCGAVKAVLSKNVKDIETVAALIEPAVTPFRNEKGENVLTDAIKANVRMIVKQLKQAPALARLIAEQKIDVIGGFYNLRTGAVEPVQ